MYQVTTLVLWSLKVFTFLSTSGLLNVMVSYNLHFFYKKNTVKFLQLKFADLTTLPGGTCKFKVSAV